MGMLDGCRVLVAEDDYLLAADTARLLRAAGATIIGPVGKLAQVQELVRAGAFDTAVLDIRLADDLVYPAADLINQAGLRFVFLTGYDDFIVPKRFQSAIHCQKPCPDEVLIDIVRRLCSAAPPA